MPDTLDAPPMVAWAPWWRRHLPDLIGADIRTTYAFDVLADAELADLVARHAGGILHLIEHRPVGSAP